MTNDIDRKRFQLFKTLKFTSLNKVDLSRKGSIDDPIKPLVELINKDPYYYTTSTCSGRIALIEKPLGHSGIKKGSKFYLNSHDTVDYNEVVDLCASVSKKQPDLSATEEQWSDGCLWFKFEPFIIHIQCYDLERAGILLNFALESGCRNSGITLGKRDKYMLAIRSTSSMEVPVVCDSKFDLGSSKEGYMRFLCEEGNQRLADNLIKLNNLYEAIKRHFEKLG